MGRLHPGRGYTAEINQPCHRFAPASSRPLDGRADGDPGARATPPSPFPSRSGSTSGYPGGRARSGARRQAGSMRSLQWFVGIRRESVRTSCGVLRRDQWVPVDGHRREGAAHSGHRSEPTGYPHVQQNVPLSPNSRSEIDSASRAEPTSKPTPDNAPIPATVTPAATMAVQAGRVSPVKVVLESTKGSRNASAVVAHPRRESPVRMMRGCSRRANPMRRRVEESSGTPMAGAASAANVTRASVTGKASVASCHGTGSRAPTLSAFSAMATRLIGDAPHDATPNRRPSPSSRPCRVGGIRRHAAALISTRGMIAASFPWRLEQRPSRAEDRVAFASRSDVGWPSSVVCGDRRSGSTRRARIQRVLVAIRRVELRIDAENSIGDWDATSRKPSLGLDQVLGRRSAGGAQSGSPTACP